MSYNRNNDEESTGSVIVAILALLLVGGIGISGLMFLLPKYEVYRQQLAGQARLREAESSRQIAVLEARAKQESAKALAEAEIERARGVAEANRIIGESLQGNDAYLKYLYITNLQETSGDRTVVYVPTDGLIPVTEAGRATIQAPVVP